jgi:hypothetical protein
VHGTVFADRAASLQRLNAGDGLTLLPDPPVEEAPRVWVHLPTGEPVGHLPTEIGDWLAPWLLRGGQARARVLRVSGPETPSWRRLLVEVRCGPAAGNGDAARGGDAGEPGAGSGRSERRDAGGSEGR